MGIIIKNTVNASIVSYIGVILGVISVLYLQTWILSPGQIGKIQLIIDKIYLFSPFVLLGTLTIAQRYIHVFKSKIEYSNFISWNLIIPLFTTSIGCILFYLIVTDKEYIFHFFVILFLSLYISVFESMLNVKAKIVYPTILRTIAFRLFMILNLILFSYDLYDFDGFILGFMLTNLAHFLFLFPYFIKHMQFQFRADFSFFSHPSFKTILTYCGYSVLGAGTGVLTSKLDTVMIKSILGDFTLVGVYAIAAHISVLIDLPRRPISQLAIPILSQKLDENRIDEVKSLYKKSAINLYIIGGLMFALLWINIDSIFEIMN